MRWIILATAAAMAMVGTASAQAPDGKVCSQGELTRIRVSKIKPGGSMAGFRDAVAAHTRWYQAHGFAIRQRIVPVILSANGRMQASPSEVMTFSTGADVPREKRDAGWQAFVAKYRANSIVEKETTVCLPS